jgi:hypothetical protein
MRAGLLLRTRAALLRTERLGFARARGRLSGGSPAPQSLG